MSKNDSYPINSWVSVQLYGMEYNVIAIVISDDPLIVATEDGGPNAHLYPDDFVLNEEATEVFQRRDQQEINMLLQAAIDRGKPYVSALAPLGIPDHNYHVMQPKRSAC